MLIVVEVAKVHETNKYTSRRGIKSEGAKGIQSTEIIHSYFRLLMIMCMHVKLDHGNHGQKYHENKNESKKIGSRYDQEWKR